MQVLRSLRWSTLRNRYSPPGIDLGNGRQMCAEDILEGHFRRLAESTSQTQDLRVQVTPTLSAAIRVMAPQLAPLTQIAEEIATTFPSVSPAPDFRRDLHTALEMAHRQHSAQRTLGTLPPNRATPNRSHVWWVALGIVLAAATFTLLWGRSTLRKRHYPQSSGS